VGWLFKGKIIIIYGPRRVGKTTLVLEIMKEYGNDAKYIDCENVFNRQSMEIHDEKKLRNFLGAGRLFIIDEAQRVLNIGISLKLLVDHYPDIQIIATGSSSFDLSNKIKEPLTGRAVSFTLFPVSLAELSATGINVSDPFSRQDVLAELLTFGSYPEIVSGEATDRILYLRELTDNYLYKDVFEYEHLKKPNVLIKLLQLLAYQIGNEVSYNELATKLEINRETVIRYVDLLEKAFVIFRLTPFSRNLRNEIGKKNKIYFYDLGIRNTLTDSFGKLETRSDIGALWENFCVLERQKLIQEKQWYRSRYFWRTQRHKEIDYLEEHDGRLYGYEFKWGTKKYSPPKEFLDEYSNSSVVVVDRSNYREFLM
jgi:hypothetical protein